MRVHIIVNKLSVSMGIINLYHNISLLLIIMIGEWVMVMYVYVWVWVGYMADS